MPDLTKLCFGLTIVGLMLLSIPTTQALPAGVKSLPRVGSIVKVRRECIAWERDANGKLVCIRWAECTGSVC